MFTAFAFEADEKGRNGFNDKFAHGLEALTEDRAFDRRCVAGAGQGDNGLAPVKKSGVEKVIGHRSVGNDVVQRIVLRG